MKKFNIKSKRNSSTMAILLLLCIALSLLSTMNVSHGGSTNATMQTNALSSELLQYEWPQPEGSNDTNTHYSLGPGPETSDILWKSEIGPGISFMPIVAFNGKVFLDLPNTPIGNTSTITGSTSTGIPEQVVAVDAITGAIVWRYNVTYDNDVRFMNIFKRDENHLILCIMSATNPEKCGTICLNPDTGEVIYTALGLGQMAPGVSPHESGSVYVDELKCYYYDADNSIISNPELAVGNGLINCWNLSDPDKPPKLEWTRISDDAHPAGHLTYGDGKIFVEHPSGFEEALNATTGETIWQTQTTGGAVYGASYYMGRLLRGYLDGNFYCLNASTGEILWKFNPGTWWSYWSTANAAAYGMVYQLCADNYLYALNVTNGDVVWKYKGPGHWYPTYGMIADGKIYQCTGTAIGRDPYTGNYSRDEFVCLNATTGELIWQLPINSGSNTLTACIAYGNLYVVPGLNNMPTETSGASTTQSTELWCIGGRQDWSMFRKDPAHTATGAGPTNLAIDWSFKTGGAVVSSPAVVNGVVYVGSQDKNIYALDAVTGSKIWSFTTGYRVMSSPAVVNGNVYIGPDDGNVYCIDAITGNQLWKTNANANGVLLHIAATNVPLRSSPTVLDGKVYVGSLDGNFYCLDADSGTVLWGRPLGGPITDSPAVVDNAVYIAAATAEPNGTLYKLDATSGSIIWQLAIPYTGFLGAIDMPTSPVVADGMVFETDNYLTLYGINATTGVITWQIPLGTPEELVATVGTLVYNEGTIYTAYGFWFASLNATNGQVNWKTWLTRELYASPAYAQGRVYIASDAGDFYVLNATDGSKLSYYHTGVHIWSSPTLYDGRIYIGHTDNNVYCFKEADLGLTTYTPSGDSSHTINYGAQPSSSPITSTSIASPAGSTAAPATVAPQQSPSSTESPIVTQSPTSPVTEAPAVTSSANQDAESSSDVYIVVVAVVAIIAVIAAIALIMKRRK